MATQGKKRKISDLFERGRPLNLEQKKDLRRQKIIDAAEALVRETGSTDFSMNALAAKAGFSTPTTYNLIGSKGTVLYILLNQYQDRLDFTSSRTSDDANPFRKVLDAAEVATRLYTDDSAFIRALMRFLLGIPDPVHRPAFMIRGYRYWNRSFDGLEDAGYFDCAINRDALSRDFLVFFTGLIDLWVHEELDDEQFSLQAECGVILRLLALTGKEDRSWMKQRLIDLQDEVEPIYGEQTA
ncbi:MAG: TetR/AcrR family transcriptional regulator [Syntrophotalea sp.]|uniref:TetR/AcrR family transcriptional regulator n=1 Tax=Syntrophotalea sp. TaxID=2812029 RepID=UPI003D145197